MISDNTSVLGIEPSDSGSQLEDGRIPAPEGLRVTEVSLDDPRLIPLVTTHPSGTVYHHPAWLRTLSAEYGREFLVLGCENRDGHLVGIFHLIYTRGLPVPLVGGLTGARLSSLPRTPIAGPLSTSREGLRMLLHAAIERVGQKGRIRLQIKTDGPFLDGVIDGFSGVPWRRSFVLSLPEDPIQLRIGASATRRAKIRSSVKRARTMGLRARMVSSGDYLHKWYVLYLETMRRVAVPPRPLRFFWGMCKYMEPLGLMKMMVVERGSAGKEELIAGSIFLMSGKSVHYGFTACPAKHFSLQPNDLMQWEAIHWAAQNGYREYDLGEAPDKGANLSSFKSKWGAEERQLYRYYYPQLPAKSSDSSVLSSYQDLLGGVWQHLPLRVTAHLGDLIYSFL
jgi:hypothetical protein